MIKKPTILALLFFFFLLSVRVCHSQLNVPETDFIYGEPVHDVRMSVTLDTNNISSGSVLAIHVKIKNFSTNDISMGETAPSRDFRVQLIDGFGKIYELSDMHPWATTRSFRMKMKADEMHDWSIPVVINKDIPVGNYLLKAARKFTMNGEVLTLESNLLKIQIK